MNIVIAGAGDVGFHLATLLVDDNQNITLIDEDEEVLSYAAEHLDVRTVLGDSSSHEILEHADVGNANLFIAVATAHATNILACLIAKKLGAEKTIARTNSTEYLGDIPREHFASLGVDELFSPGKLAVDEINRLLKRVSTTDFVDFENGKISFLGFTADGSSKLIGRQFKDVTDEATDYHIKVVCVLRDEETILVKPEQRINKGDHIYLATDSDGLSLLNDYIGKSLRNINNVMIIGDTRLAMETACLLEESHDVKVIMQSEKACKKFIKHLKHALIIKGNPNNNELLQEEGLEFMDAFIALTPNSETNILASLSAEKAGVYKTIALVDNIAYTHISQNIGVDTIINKKLLAANEIFRHLSKGKVEAIASFHGVDGKIIEYQVGYESSIINKSICDIDLHGQAVIAGVVRNEKGIIPKSDFVFQEGDHVVVFGLPGELESLNNIFK